MAAALRLLLRRRADTPSAPSLALLQPLFPRPYSKLSALPVPSPSLLRRTSGEGCSALLPVPRKRTDRGCEATQRPIQSSSPLLGVSAAYNLGGIQRVQIQPSPPQVPSLIRHYSSKGCAASLPLQPTDPQTCQFMKQAESLIGASNDSVKQLALAHKAIKTCGKAYDLLGAGVDDNKAFAMLEKGLDDALNALAVFEKDLDVLAKALGSTKGMQHDIDNDLEPQLVVCKRIKNSLESMRQELKELKRARENQRMLEKICKWLEFANAILGALVLLMIRLMIRFIMLHFIMELVLGWN